MSESNTSDHESISTAGISSETSDEENYGVVLLGAAVPYQGEPLARPGGGQQDNRDDKDGLSRETLAARYEGHHFVEEWCRCGECHIDLLTGSLEYRCCREVQEAIEKLVGVAEDTRCITAFEGM
eukprot:gene17079-8596_t